MNQPKDKRIKRYKKRSIWPSIVGFILVIASISIAAVIIMSFFFVDLISSKLTSGERMADTYAKQIQTRLDEGEAIEDIIKDEEFESEFYILDYQNKTFISSDGRKREFKVLDLDLISREYTVYYADTDDDLFIAKYQNGIEISDEVTIDVDDLLEYCAQELREDDNVLEMNLWFKAKEGSDNGQQFLVKEKIIIHSYEVMNFVAVCFVMGFIIIVIAVVLFINIVSTVINHNKMMGALYYDDITGGKNWLYFKTKADKKLKKKKKKFALLSICNTKYNSYCICYGGEAGERLLMQMYRNISNVLSKKYTFARQTEAYFGVLVDYQTMDELEAVIHNIKDTLDTTVEDSAIHIGVFLVPVDGKIEGHDDEKWTLMVEHYYHHARIACESLGDFEETGVKYFDKKLQEAHLWEHKVESKMNAAIEREEFVVYLQPKYDPKTKALKGAEALVRWINEEDGFISPAKFIPIFEKNGFILKLDDYMVERVAKLQAEWIKEGFNVVPISVNISRAHFTREDLTEHICSLIDKYDVPHNLVELELTESAFFEEKNIIMSTVNKMQNAGFHVSMDDFGSGFSSLNSLKDLPLDVLKLDAEFFRGDTEDERGEVIVGKTIELAKDLDMEIVAEGVEKERQVNFLAGVGCDMIQGFYFDKPMPCDEFEERMKAGVAN